MTLTDIKFKIYKFFETNDSFVSPDDLEKVTEVSPANEAVILLALKDFEIGGLVKKVEFKNGKQVKNSWILEKPLKNYPQTITIPGDTAAYIADLINSLAPNKNEAIANPLSISHLEIETVCSLLTELLKQPEVVKLLQQSQVPVQDTQTQENVNGFNFGDSNSSADGFSLN